MEEEIEQLRARIEGLGLILSVVIAALPNRSEVVANLKLTEEIARERNLVPGILLEMMVIRESLEDLDRAKSQRRNR